MHLNQGTMLMGRTYRIIKVLGQGGFGITYLAENVKLEKSVAIKEFFPKDYCIRDGNSLTVGAETNREFIEKLKERFVKEAKNIARLDHPGIVVIHDIFQENSTAYYVMDYIEGESLSQIVKRSGPLPEKQALEYIKKVGEALSYIHGKKMTHFDVKPANIMLKSQNGQPVLIDFGLSKQFDQKGSATSSVLQAVSHGYSSLELYNPEAIKTFTPSPDIYALGATLYYLMSGVTPPNATVVFDEGLTIPGNVPEKYHAIIRKAMSPARNDRYPTIYLFIVALSSPESGGYISAASNKTSGLQIADGHDYPKPPPLKVKTPQSDVTQRIKNPSDNNVGWGENKKDSNINWRNVSIGMLITFILITCIVVLVNHDSSDKHKESILWSEMGNVDENADPVTVEIQESVIDPAAQEAAIVPDEPAAATTEDYEAAAAKETTKKESKSSKNKTVKDNYTRSTAAERPEDRPTRAPEVVEKTKESVDEKGKDVVEAAKAKAKEKLKDIRNPKTLD